MNRNLSAMALIVAAAFTLTACGSDDEKSETKSPSQVVAKVNGTELTVHQLNFLLKGQPQVSDAVKQQALDRLIDQEVLVQKAVEMKLDRDPNVLQALEAARRQILSQAVLERQIGTHAAQPNTADVDKFYSDHPALFANRKIYDFQVFVIDQASMSDALRAALDTAHTPEDVVAALGAAGAKFDQKGSRIAAEQLPLPLLDKFAALNVGDIMSLPESGKIALMQLVATADAPVARADADKAIQAYLGNTGKEKAVKDKVAELKSGAKVEYLTRYAEEGAAAVAPAAPATADAKSDASLSDESIQAGVKGLK
ncbi:EpsD family peptidyl-prolyl cis-trans isomerase [Chitinibacteraceae bacterium HSL-7]